MGHAPTGATKKRSTTLPVLTVTVICAIGAAALEATAPQGHPNLALWVCVFLGTSVLEGAVARFAAGNQRWTLSVTEAVLVTVLVCTPGVWVAVPGMLGLLVAHVARRRRDPLKLAFNACMFAFAFGLGGAVAAWAGSGMAGAVAGGLAFWGSNLLLLHLVMVVVTGVDKATAILKRSLPLSVLHMAVNVVVGLTAGVLAREHPLGALGILAPLGAVLACYEAITRRVDENHLLGLLLTTQDQVRPRPLEEYAQAIVSAAAELFGSTAVQLLVLHGADGPVRVTLDAAGSTRAELATEPDMDQPWVLRSLASQGAVTAGNTLATSWCTVRIGAPSQPLAVLVVHKPAGSGAGVNRRDQRLARALALRAQAWLELSAAAADHGDAPALTSLRSAVYRLVDSAERLEVDGTEALVNELHRVQRAVTALLGSTGADESVDPGTPRMLSMLTPLDAVRAVDTIGLGAHTTELPAPAPHENVVLLGPGTAVRPQQHPATPQATRSAHPHPRTPLVPTASGEDWVRLPGREAEGSAASTA